MPITQDRMISVIAKARTAYNTIDMLRELAQTIDIRENNILANSLISHVGEQATKDGIMALYQSLSILHEAITEIYISQEHRNNIMEEEIHFKKWFKHNKIIANYKRVKRSIASNLAASMAQVPAFGFIADTTPAPSEPSRREPPPYAALTMSERVAQRKARGVIEQMPDTTNLPIFPPGETDVIAPTPGASGASYDPEVLSTSTPSAETLRDTGVDPKGNVI